MLYVHSKVSVGVFDYVIVGRGTACITCRDPHPSAGLFRNLLASSEQEERRTGVTLLQTAFYLPDVSRIDDALDVGAAAASYLRRHPRLEAAYVIAPEMGAVPTVLAFVTKVLPSFSIRACHSVDEVTQALRVIEPEIPSSWHDLGVFPDPGLTLTGVEGMKRSTTPPPPPAKPVTSRPPPRKA